MRHALSSKQSSFFADKGFIELEGVLSPIQCHSLLQEAESVRSQRLKGKRLQKEQRLFAGRDLWRSSDLLRREVCSVSLARLGSELFQNKPLRLAYDQLWDSLDCACFPKAHHTLDELTCIQGLVGGVMLCLQKKNQEEPDVPELAKKSDSEIVADVFAKEVGSAVYFLSTVPLNLLSVAQEKGSSYLLVAYAGLRPVYTYRAEDPHTHGLKDLGYAFGDVLKEETHPLVYR